ncbi:carbohydrate sulfotransferase 11-like isoform X2 [Orussus abietinus]|uniref:carbohydrate sulfotransferase 11-like isoform X2 n=1 Tax=Orussus abietinus TaxID=222816 RepID=UPI0006250B30|nr:carbohydrate sulfotransferase 11-like isoform X2 [Orussus abietinus]
MTAKIQFGKCVLCVVVYIVVCLILVKTKTSFLTRSKTFLVHKSKGDKCGGSIVNESQSVDLEIKRVEYDELKDLTVDSQENAVLLQRVVETCSKYNLSNPIARKHFLYSPRHRALYCWIRKSASTSFTKIFSDMRNHQVTHNYYKEAEVLAPETSQVLEALINDVNVFKFFVVRHPFERLVSFYRDRIEDNSKYTAQAWIYAPKIFYLTRPNLFHSNKTTGGLLKKIFTNDRRLKLIPSFKEFITWLLRESPERDDPHWALYHSHCSVCEANFNFLLKLEHKDPSEINYVFSKLNLNQSETYLPILGQTRNGVTDFTRTCGYFKSLSHDIVYKLYERYKVDFEMFNYDFDQYVECAKTDV